MIDAKEARFLSDENKEDIIARYDFDKTENLRKVEEKVSLTIKKGERSFCEEFIFTASELEYLRLKGYEVRLNVIPLKSVGYEISW